MEVTAHLAVLFCVLEACNKRPFVGYMLIRRWKASYNHAYNSKQYLYATKHTIIARLDYMTQATLIIHNEDGTEAYHAHSSSDDLMDILIQFEDQIIEYGNSKDNETDS